MDPVTRLNAALEGRYHIESELGEGGMATVYLADDVKHERKVALKVLKPELAAVVGAERFLAEIKTTANLQHPHILPLFDSGEADSFLFYVMPYVKGESLQDRLDRERQLPVDEAVKIAIDLAEALDYAHRHEVIHRDIKPANILMHEGRPLIADFGIALAVGAAGGGRLTETGLSLGTPFYMSPEQATGEQFVGASTDTYALGSVLYEMLVGEPPYTGATAQAILGRIIMGGPTSATEHRSSVPAHVDGAIRKALEKLPADRFTSAQDFARALGDEHFRHGEPVAGVADASSGAWNRLSIGLAGLALSFAAAFGWALLRPEPPNAPQRFALTFPESQQPVAGFAGAVYSLLPDGSGMVYEAEAPAGRQLFLRYFNALEGTPIPGTETGYDPQVSPDGESVAFYAQSGGQQVVRMATLSGGTPYTVTDSLAYGASWGPDGKVYGLHIGTLGLGRVSETGGAVERLTQPDSGTTHRFPSVFPNGKGALFTITKAELADYMLGVVSFETGEIREITSGFSGYYVATGHIVFTRADHRLYAAPFDQERMELTGPALRMIDEVAYTSFGLSGFEFSADGTLMYEQADASAADRLVWVDPGGGETNAVLGSGNFGPVALSPTDERVAVEILSDDGAVDIWIYDLLTGGQTRFTVEGDNYYPSWIPGWITFLSSRGGVRAWYRKRSDGSEPSQRMAIPVPPVLDYVWSADGRFVVFPRGSSESDLDLWFAEPARDSTAQLLFDADGRQRNPSLSPDGRLLAYQSSETGRPEVWVRAFPESGRQWQISTIGGFDPRWSHDGRRIFFRGPTGEVMEAGISSSPTFSSGVPRELFGGADYSQWDVGRNDDRFLMVKSASTRRRDVVIVLNWFEELKERLGN